MSVLIGNGDGSFAAGVRYATGQNAGIVAVAYLNGDAFLDLAVTNEDSDNVSVLMGIGDGTFSPAQSYAVGDNPHGVTAADLNGDGVLDLAVANHYSDDVSVLIGIGGGAFADATSYDAGDGPQIVVVGDLNGDAIPDLAVSNKWSGDVSVLLGIGNGTFAAAQEYSAGSLPHGLAAADLDGDGVLDLAVANNGESSISLLRGVGDGTFGSAEELAVGPNRLYLAAGDLDGNGIPDLAVPNYSSDTVSVLLNRLAGVWRSGTVRVSAYDMVGVPHVHPSDIRVKFGSGNVVSSIQLGGYQAMEGLGIVVSGASSVGSIKDGRKGTKGDVAFIASDAPIKSIQIKGGMSSYNLNGLTLAGLAFAADIDGDADTDDATAIYSTGYVQNIKVDGQVGDEEQEADIWIGGHDSKGVALGSYSSKSGGYHGDLTANGNVGKISLGGTFGSSMGILGSLKSFQVKGGDFEGQLDVTGDLGKFEVKAGKTSGGWFCAGANVNVGGLLGKVSATNHETDNGGADFGIFAGQFGSIQVAEHRLKEATLPFEEGDFCVELVP